MKEIFDYIIIVLFVILLFIFVRGFVKTQVDKHNEKLKDADIKTQLKSENKKDKKEKISKDKNAKNLTD